MNEYLSKEGLRQLCIKIRKALQRVPNDNLLDNWYFVGGGSQLGWGTFPVNHRGQVEYAANGGYAFDRWKLGYTVSAGKVMITPEGVKLIRNTLDSGVSEISQVLRFAPKDMVTLSILSADNELTTATGKLGVLAGGNSKNGLRFATTTDIVRIRSVGVQELTLVAAMLEPGTEQHLAHKEGGRWVLNRVPDFREELAKCQAYQVEINLLSDRFAYLGIGMAREEHIAEILVPLTVTLRAKPIISMSGPWQLNDYDSQRTVTDITLETSTLSANILTVNAITTTTKLIIGKTYVLTATSPSARLLLDSNP